MNLSSAVNLASRIENILLRIEGSKSTVHIDQSLSSLQESELSVTGHFTGVEKTIRFYYGNNSKSAGTQEIKIKSVDHCDETATERLPMLSTFEMIIKNNNWYPQLEFGKKERVVTTRTSFIVLEKIEDYIQYNILPPKELEKECDMSQFVKNDQNMRNQFWKASVEQILTNVLREYNQRLQWWNTNEPIQLAPEDFISGTYTNEIKRDQAAEKDNLFGSSNNFNADFKGEAALQEVVVTAYGMKRNSKSLGYSAATIRNEEITLGRSFTLSGALSGKVAGLTVYNTNNAVVPEARIVLRGNRSIIGNNQPLVVLDGVPVPQGTINFLNPNDIETITVLKSGQASALYGSDGVNGVLVINSKKKIYSSNYYNRLPYKLKNKEDVDYVKIMKRAAKENKLSVYEELKEEYKGDPNFYIDMAVLLYESGDKNNAIEVLMSTADITEGNISVLRAIGFVLEEWKEFDEAINIYNSILERDPLNAGAMHNLAFAYYLNGKYQLAIDKLYEAIKTNFEEKEGYLLSMKASMLQEMNAIISMHKSNLELAHIPEKLIRPIEADMRISVSLNLYHYAAISVVEPDKTKCNIYKLKTDMGGRFSSNSYYWNGGGVDGEYQIKKAKKGKYSVRLDYSDWYHRYYTDIGLPSMARVMLVKNFGRLDQHIVVQNVMLNNQTGDFEISEVNWE
jgi:TonB-dependent SusC/RagA subfamily outer membrane receptor